MTSMRVRSICIFGVVPLLCGLFLLAGCEEATDLSGLKVEPASAKVSPGSNTVWLTVVGGTNQLSFPLKWTVAQPSLGSIVENSGVKALYQANLPFSTGENVVTVTDQYEHEGLVTVKHLLEQYAVTLQVTVSGTSSNSLNNSIPFGSNLATITVTSQRSMAPYQWWVSDPSLGAIIGGGSGGSVVYRSSGPGANVINVRDANGVEGATVVTQLAAPSPGPGN